jgi:ribulose bisphosphate carboxylase small subunit
MFSRYKDGNNRMPVFVSFSGGYGNKIVFENIVGGINRAVLSDTTINANTWHHLALTCGTGGMQMYLNGVKQASTNATTDCFSAIAATTSTDFGAHSGGNFFKGTIDEVRISNTVRSASEIRQLYELNRRTHPVTIDFVSGLNSANLITGSSDLSFTVNDATKLYLADKVIIKENIGGTQYTAQATVNTKTGNAITVASWDTGSTFPSSGYTANATVMKWQKEYFDLGGISSEQRNAVTKITLRTFLNGAGANVWVDEVKSNVFMNDSAADSFNTQTGIGNYSATIDSTPNFYYQYRAILNSWDANVSPQLNSVTTVYGNNTPPTDPVISAPANGATGVLLTPALSFSSTDSDAYLRYKVQIATDNGFTTGLQTFDQTVSQTGWSGQNAQTGTAYTSATTATHTVQSALLPNTVYYIRAYAIDPTGSNRWSSASTTVSFTTNAAPGAPTLNSSVLFDKAKTPSTTPSFRFVSTDANSNPLIYEFNIDTNSTFATQTVRVSGTDAGFSNTQNGAESSPFTQNQTIQFTVQAGNALVNGNTYYWRVRARDPAGANTWSSFSTVRSLTIDTSLTKDMWFESLSPQFASDLGGSNTQTTGDKVSLVSQGLQLLEGANNYTQWVSSTPLTSTQDTVDKQEGTGSVKVVRANDGALSVTTGTTTINTVSSGGVTGTGGSSTLNMTSTTGLAVGDEILIVQITGTGAGNYEARYVSIVNSSTQITLANGLTNTYSAGAQMLRIPHYTSVSVSSGATLTAPAWDGTKGGVLVFRADGGTVTNAGTITMTGKGINTGTGGGGGGGGRGGHCHCIPGVPPITDAYPGGGSSGGGGTAAGGGGGGGGGGVSGGGGGAGYGVAGTASSGAAGVSYGQNTLQTMFLGSGGGGGGGGNGGGGGGAWCGNCGGDGTDETAWGGGGGGGGRGGLGGTGGGIIYLSAQTLQNNNIISSNGGTGNAGSNGGGGGTAGGYDSGLPCNWWGAGGNAGTGGGGGGGGSGGSIFIQSSTTTIGTIQANGGSSGGGGTGASGGTGSGCDQPAGSGSGGGSAGGAGAVGRIRCDNSAGNCTATTPTAYSAVNSYTPPSTLNTTVTYTYPSSTNLFGSSQITFWVKSDSTGSYRFQMGELSSSEQTFDFTINTANTWEQKTWNISAIPNTSKDATKYLEFKFLQNLNSVNFWFDKIEAVGSVNSYTSSAITASSVYPSGADTWGPILFSHAGQGGSITYQVWYDNSGIPTIISDGALPGNSAGFSTSPVTLSLSPITYPTIYLVAQLAWPAGLSPELYDWGIKLNKKSTAPTITAPTNGATGLTTSPVIQLNSTDNDTDYLRYKIQIATDNAFTLNLQTFDQTVSQTGWSGQNTQTSTAYTSGTMATYTIQTPLNANTTYYIRAYSIDQGGTATWSSTSSTVSFATNATPNAPAISAPLNGATGVSILPAIQLAATDPEGNYLRYKIQLATDAGFSQNLQTFDQTISQTGWGGQNAQTGTAYNSGSTATYTVQSALTSATTYYIRAYATDPGGSLLWSSTSSTISFTVGTFVAPTNCSVSAGSSSGPSIITWTDGSTIEDNYYLETSVNSGAFTPTVTLAANTITSSQTVGYNTYQYRIRASSGGQYTAYCTTSAITYYAPGNIQFEGVGLEGIQVH